MATGKWIMMGKWFLALLVVAQVQSADPVINPARDPRQQEERTSFQTAGPWDPKVDIKSDVAMIYGFHGDVDGRVRGWRDHGYIIQFMTGVAWGNYQDYFSGKWDGRSHEDEAQTERDGKPILHGPTVPYVAPSETYGKYLCLGVKRAIDAGACAIHLEEPEFWVRGGYSGSFKREWQSFYNEPWMPPHSSPDAQYRASKLKYFLYRRALQQVFDYVVEDNRQSGRQVRCYVPTHSLLNYAHWRIVSPEQSLVLLNGCDGYVGQVWTGTARTPNCYQGVLKERTFETAFFEYGVLQNLVRSTGRRMYFLNDPVEDDPNHSWEDYRRNWECTLVASLLWPEVWRYEVAPWPERPFTFQYPARDKAQRKAGEQEQRVGISPEYATELMTVFNALNDMRQAKVAWDCGTGSMGILVSDSLMFQRGDPNPSDAHMGSFYGLAMPLIKQGCPLQPVQLENIELPRYLEPFRVLFCTYEGMKPLKPEYHARLAQWVKEGGVLAFVDNDADPYNKVREWWNSGSNKYEAPRLHLFECLGIKNEPGTQSVGKGAVLFLRESPAALAGQAKGAERMLALAEEACGKAGISWTTTSHLLLRSGPYLVGAGLDESSVTSTKTLGGSYINLFDPQLKVINTVELKPGSRWLLFDLKHVAKRKPAVLASAAKTTSFTVKGKQVRYYASGPDQTIASTRLALPRRPASVKIGDFDDAKISSEWDEASHTLLLMHPNVPAGVWVAIDL